MFLFLRYRGCSSWSMCRPQCIGFAASCWLNFSSHLLEFKQLLVAISYHVVMAQREEKKKKRLFLVFANRVIWLKDWVCFSVLEKILFNTLGPNFTFIIANWQLAREFGEQKSDLLLWADRKRISCYMWEYDLPSMLKISEFPAVLLYKVFFKNRERRKQRVEN